VTETVSFVIPTHRRPDALRQTLERVTAVEHPHDALEVVVVDNAGEPATEQVVAALGAGPVPVRYEYAPAGGAAAARNRGAAVASGRLLIFCDDDIIVEPSHVRRQLELQRLHPGCVGGGDWELGEAVRAQWATTPFGRYRLALQRSWREQSVGTRLDDHRLVVRTLAACNLAIERRRFLELGGFDERFPYAGAEDAEFSARARSDGCLLILDESVRLRHNDQHVSLAQFCERERRSAATRAVLYALQQDDPIARGFATVNGPISLRDPNALIAKKLVKRALAAPRLAGLMTAGLGALEPVLSDHALARLYAAAVGVHIQQGFRDGAKRRLSERPVEPT